MRRVLTVAALGLLWAQAARAQGEPFVFGEDYNPPELMYVVGGGLDVHVGSFSSIPEIENEEAWLVNRVPALAWDRGDDIDGAWFKVIARTSSGMRWENLFPSCLDRITPQPYTAECSCLDILNYLCFFDDLSPLSVGPNMGPIFYKPTGQIMGHGCFR